MSRPRSRSPVYSRIPTLQGRRGEGLNHNQSCSSFVPGPWRNPENIKTEISLNRNKDSFQEEQHVDQWSRFIRVIEDSQKSCSIAPRYHTQPVEQRATSPQWKLSREKLPSPDHPHHGVVERYRMSSPVQNRNEHQGKLSSNFKEMSDRHYPRHSEERRRDRMEPGYPDERGDRYQERGSFSERSSKSDYREQHPSSKGQGDLGFRDEFVHHRGPSPFRSPVVVDHGHGITKHVSRDRDLQDMGGHSRSRDRPRSSESQMYRDPGRDRRDQGHQSRTSHDYRHGRPLDGRQQEETRKTHSSHGRESQGRERSRHTDQYRMESRSRDSEDLRKRNFQEIDSDLRTKERNSSREWEEKMIQSNQQTRMEEEEVRSRVQRIRNLKSNVGSAPRMDFEEQETLKIVVDMSRPFSQSSYSGYSSDRQLSLDLVNVGRQRLDFLPMLEHSGSYRESEGHRGTFAEEIISLVHHVKENFFRGQEISLNERFSNGSEYSVHDFKDVDQEENIGNIRPSMNRAEIRPLLEDLDPRIKLGPEQADLRLNLERRRQQRLEGVKITIAGDNFAQRTSEHQETSSSFLNNSREREEKYRWSQREQSQRRQMDDSQQRMPEPAQRNKMRGNFNRKGRQHGRRI